jgi:membrane protein DedA with SNARE-associated domain
VPIIPKDREVYFLVVFLIQFVGWLILVYNQIPDEKTGTLKAVYVGQEMAPLVIVSTAVSIALVEGVAMLYEAFARKRESRGLEKGIRQSRERLDKALDEMNGKISEPDKAKLRDALAERNQDK